MSEALEPERYELFAEPAYHFSLTRRELLSLLATGLTVLLLTEPASAQDLAAWLHIGADNTITAFTGKTEVGQNIRTSLSQAVSEELGVPLGSVRLVMADTALTPFDAGTFGSRTTPTMAPQLRRAAAAAREALLALAAARWQVEARALRVEAGAVRHEPTGRALRFGELTGGQKLVQKVDPGAISPPQKAAAPKVGGRAFVTGAHVYTSDLHLPGMLYGAVVRPPHASATLLSCDTSAARALPGITVVQEGSFVGVAAPTSRAARAARARIKAEWQTGPLPSHDALFRVLRETATGEKVAFTPEKRALPDGGQHLATAYEIDYIAHVPLEPRAAVAEWSGDRVTVWTGTQRPFGVQGELAQAFGIPASQVRVIVPDTGSGYGGKHTGEVAVEAARLARAARKPVKLVWTREEELTCAYFRPAGVIEITAATDRDGTLTAWEMHNFNSGGSALETPYTVAGARTRFHPATAPLRQGSYRGLAATANTFAREVHLDQLAAALKKDPLALRRRNLTPGRLWDVLEAATSAFGWVTRQKRPGHGFGLACGTEKGGFVATCVELVVEASGELRLLRATTAFECGAIVNPEHLKSQVEGAVIQGIGGALWERILFTNGVVETTSLTRYRVPRFKDIPPLETILLDRKDLPSAGAGECPIIAIAPAIGNALFDASGTIPHGLPLAPRA